MFQVRLAFSLCCHPNPLRKAHGTFRYLPRPSLIASLQSEGIERRTCSREQMLLRVQLDPVTMSPPRLQALTSLSARRRPISKADLIVCRLPESHRATSSSLVSSKRHECGGRAAGQFRSCEQARAWHSKAAQDGALPQPGRPPLHQTVSCLSASTRNRRMAPRAGDACAPLPGRLPRGDCYCTCASMWKSTQATWKSCHERSARAATNTFVSRAPAVDERLL